ncbi:hypothetical protein LDENG_00042470 [Lucifuga dentata]|nr:hypothetical protein LDENG_00042470 [Lucifuga dentata]
MYWKMAVSNLTCMQVVFIGLKHAKSLVWSFNSVVRSVDRLFWSETGTKLLVWFSFTQKNIQSNQNISAKVMWQHSLCSLV